MDTKALRQKILDLAIRGKLVPQDPNDEPASVLLERICQQKQQMVKEGKCVIMVSSELPEVLAMSDHVIVMRGGRVMANIERDSKHFNSEDIMKAAWGGELD